MALANLAEAFRISSNGNSWIGKKTGIRGDRVVRMIANPRLPSMLRMSEYEMELVTRPSAITNECESNREDNTVPTGKTRRVRCRIERKTEITRITASGTGITATTQVVRIRSAKPSASSASSATKVDSIRPIANQQSRTTTFAR